MTLTLRIVLIACSLMTFIYATRKIRAARVDIADTIFWIVFSAVLLVISVFPSIMEGLAALLGVQSEVNMVFLCAIAALTYKCFALTLKLSALEIRVKTLTAAVAVRSAEKEVEDRANAAEKSEEIQTV